MLSQLYRLGAFKRTAVLWVAFMVMLWGSFGLARLANPGAFTGIVGEPGADAMSGIALFGFIVVMNSLVMLLIAGGNVFVRFGWVTPGLVVLIAQGLQIGWLAGSNGFEMPFATVEAANQAFLRIGLWETSAYALICGVTLTKSLNVSATFPPRTWIETHRLTDLRLHRSEAVLTATAVVMLVCAALSETFVLS
jgi:hypothetical protein